MTQTFKEWLDELEGYSIRMERVYDDLITITHKDNTNKWKYTKEWLKAAFDAGYYAGEFNKEYFIKDLKNEILRLNKEIEELREEIHSLLDKDRPAG